MISDHQVIDFPKLDKIAFSVASLFDESDEKVYWWSKTPHQRLQHTELLRRINYGNQASQPLRVKDFWRLLNDKQVDYLLIGGYAVSYTPRVREAQSWLSACRWRHGLSDGAGP